MAAQQAPGCAWSPFEATCLGRAPGTSKSLLRGRNLRCDPVPKLGPKNRGREACHEAGRAARAWPISVSGCLFCFATGLLFRFFGPGRCQFLAFCFVFSGLADFSFCLFVLFCHYDARVVQTVHACEHLHNRWRFWRLLLFARFPRHSCFQGRAIEGKGGTTHALRTKTCDGERSEEQRKQNAM